MKKIYTLLVILFPLLNYAQQPCKEIFISEYVDGSNKNKVIEIFNPSDSVVNLVGYYIRIYQNGAPTPDIIPLQGSINPKETHVITHPQADNTILAKAQQTDVKMNYDGNDAIVLRKGISTDVDKIGEIGVNPGSSGWTVLPTGSTKDSDLRRKFPIDKGEGDWNNGKNQWTVLPKDSLQDIKIHDNTCSQIIAPTCTELFISEYLDGNQKDKIIEIFNPTDSLISLLDYSLKIFQNGAPTPLDIPLQGNINPKETYVIAHPQANSTILSKSDQTDVKLNFDGNDAVVLNKGTSTYIDKIGEIAINPGSNGWTIPPNSTTKNIDLRRKFPIDKGEGDWNNGKNQWDVFPRDSIQNIKQHQNICSAKAINFSFANQQISEDSLGNPFYEFDVMVSSVDDTDNYIDYVHVAIKYDTITFGTYINSNGGLIVSAGGSFNYNSYIDPSIWTGDISKDTFPIWLNPNASDSSFSRVLLTSNPIQLFHIKMKIKQCNNPAGISFGNADTQWNDSPTLDPGWGVPYSPINYGNGIDDILCQSIIFNFTSSVPAGTFYEGTQTNEWLLTINGYGFGDTIGTVSFKNANDGGNSYCILDDIDFISWSNTKVEIKMPSRLLFDSLCVPGSGIIAVFTNNFNVITSTSPINIPYGIFSSTLNNKKTRWNLANVTNDSTMIGFYLSTTITNHPDTMVELAVRKAITDWICNTKVNFKILGETPINFADTDGVSVITFVNSFSDPALLGATTSRKVQCFDANGDSIYLLKEVDIEILYDPTTVGSGVWYYDTIGDLPAGQYDFFEAMIHEVGHATLLKHVNNNIDLMYYTTKYDANSDILFGNRRWIASDDFNGGMNAMDISVNTIVGSCSISAVTGTQSEYTCINVGIKEKQIESLINFSVFPNPFSNDIYIKYTVNKKTSVQFLLFDHHGGEIINTGQKKLDRGEYIEQLNINNIQSGLYFLMIKSDNNIFNYKLISIK